MIKFINFEDNTFIYFLGRYWADGTGKDHELDCKYEDMIHLKNWFESFGFEVKTGQKYKNGEKYGKLQGRIRFKNSDFDNKFLKENGFFTKSKDSPSIILSKIPKEKHYLFWRGYFDGDGCIYVNNKFTRKEISFWGSINQDWSKLISLLDSIGIKYTTNKYIRKSGKSSCIAFYSYDDIIKFCEYIYEDFQINEIGLKRKWETFQRLKNRGIRRKTSKYIGICHDTCSKKWQVMILKSETGKKNKFLGWYKTEKDAVNAKINAIGKVTEKRGRLSCSEYLCNTL